mmetsp:Transcript_24393/g.44447  ORF Transcript_24393/g.44447 Transcript_24393/m.44447 type:complete len:216 (+) Transcript_24393:3-650(+)
MLRVTQIPHVLEQLTNSRPAHPNLPGGGIQQGRVLGAILMTRHGALLGSSGFSQTDDSNPMPTAKIMGAIVSNVWGEYASGIAPAAAVQAASPPQAAADEAPIKRNSESRASSISRESGGGGSFSSGNVVSSAGVGLGEVAMGSAWSAGAEGRLDVLMLDLEHGQVAVAGMCGGAYLLCAYADDTLPVGMLKSKLSALAAFLEESLQQLALPNEQ